MPERFEEPPLDCPRCPRLVAFRNELRKKYPENWHNAPVRSFGGLDARMLIVGLAPGMKGANRTGRPFTGDYAGDLLYSTLSKYGFSEGTFKADPKDGLKLVDARIANAVRCLPPENKPEPAEFTQCRPFIQAELAVMPKLKVILALGRTTRCCAPSPSARPAPSRSSTPACMRCRMASPWPTAITARATTRTPAG
jgi:uracil-DNA glycosylase family 4